MGNIVKYLLTNNSVCGRMHYNKNQEGKMKKQTGLFVAMIVMLCIISLAGYLLLNVCEFGSIFKPSVESSKQELVL